MFGTLGVALMFCVQVPLGDVCRWLERHHPQRPVYKLLYEDAVYVVVYFTLILLWRGYWNLNAT